MGSIDTWSFGEGNASYADRFELVVGCTAARYAEIVDPKALLELRTEDAEEYAVAQREVRETRARKTQLCVLLVLEALAREVGCTPEALAERLAGTLYVEVNLADVARRLDGPLAVGSKTVRSNAGQCLKDLLHKHSALNVGLLSSPDDRGVHTTRRAHATVQVGGRWVCVPQGPTVKQVRAAFEEHWVKSGLVNLGVPIVKWEFTWSPGMDGEWLDTESCRSRAQHVLSIASWPRAAERVSLLSAVSPRLPLPRTRFSRKCEHKGRPLWSTRVDPGRQ